MNYSKSFKFDVLDDKIVDYINSIASSTNGNILIEIPNTKGVSSELVKKLNNHVYIRVAGGYTDDVVKNMKNVQFTNGEDGKQLYVDSVIYSKNELSSIIEEIEKIESRIDSKWSDFEKFAAIYTYLKSDIFYDPEFEKKDAKGIGSRDMRTLRGLITKNTVCAGYAMILKEMLDRQDISCDYVDGSVVPNENGGHAWNIVNLDGKNYGIDLTWDNRNYRDGNFRTSQYFGQKPSEFARKHYPWKFYKLQNYASSLSEFDPKVVSKVMSSFSRDMEFPMTTYKCIRSDKSQFLLGQAGEKIVNGVRYYRYIYSDIDSNGKQSNPIILYSESNVVGLVNDKNFKKYYPANAFNVMLGILFSKENIQDSLNRGTSYIGKYRKGGYGTNTILVSDVKEISKPDSVNSLFKTSNSKTLVRSDGTKLVLVKNNNLISTPYGYVYKYIVFEILSKKGKSYVKKNTIFTEMDLFNDNRRDMIDKFLSRRRLDNIMLRSGGYIGRYDANGNLINNPDMFNYFKMNKKIDENGKIHGVPDPNRVDFDKLNKLKIDFKTLYDYAMRYSVVYNSSTGKYAAKEIATGKIILDNNITDIAILANLWLGYAGSLTTKNDKRPGELYAFSNKSYKIYEMFLNSMIDDVTKSGVIDTVSLFKNVYSKYGDEGAKIIVGMFSSPRNCKLINNIIRNICNVTSKKNDDPLCLYSLYYAKKIINNNIDNKKDNKKDAKKDNNKKVDDTNMIRLDKIKDYYNSVSKELSDIDKGVYNALINLVNDDKCGKVAINTLDGYLHNVVKNKQLSNYFTMKDSEIVNSFVLPDNISNNQIINIISNYNQKIVSINFFAERVKKAREINKDKVNPDKKNDNKKDKDKNKDKIVPDKKKDKKKDNKNTDSKKSVIVKIKNIPEKIKEKVNKKKVSFKDKKILSKLKKYLNNKIDEIKKRKGRSK